VLLLLFSKLSAPNLLDISDTANDEDRFNI